MKSSWTEFKGPILPVQTLIFYQRDERELEIAEILVGMYQLYLRLYDFVKLYLICRPFLSNN